VISLGTAISLPTVADSLSLRASLPALLNLFLSRNKILILGVMKDGSWLEKATVLDSFIIILCLIAFPLTPKHVTLNDPESPFCVKFCFAPVCLEL